MAINDRHEALWRRIDVAYRIVSSLLAVVTLFFPGHVSYETCHTILSFQEEEKRKEENESRATSTQ